MRELPALEPVLRDHLPILWQADTTWRIEVTTSGAPMSRDVQRDVLVRIFALDSHRGAVVIRSTPEHLADEVLRELDAAGSVLVAKEEIERLRAIEAAPIDPYILGRVMHHRAANSYRTPKKRAEALADKLAASSWQEYAVKVMIEYVVERDRAALAASKEKP